MGRLRFELYGGVMWHRRLAMVTQLREAASISAGHFYRSHLKRGPKVFVPHHQPL